LTFLSGYSLSDWVFYQSLLPLNVYIVLESVKQRIKLSGVGETPLNRFIRFLHSSGSA
jgi:hypothetical protein